jgi:hypothetical protein
MRLPAAAALVLALAPAAAEARPRAAIAFLPWGGTTRGMLDALAQRQMAIGFTSPTVGGFKTRQMALDMSQGTRIPVRLYSGPIGSLALRRTREGWALADWLLARRRAADAPGDLAPGLLASTVEGGGARVGYVGVRGRSGPGAIVATDESGHIRGVSLGPASTAAQRIAALWRRDDVVLADLPPDATGLDAVDALLRARKPGDVVYVVQSPRGSKLRLLPSGLAGPAGSGELRSATTRVTGLVAAIDVAPTVLDALGLHVPGKMEGEPIVPRGRADPSGLVDLDDRLAVVAPRRGYTLAWLAGAMLAAVALLGALAGRRGVRAGVRIAALAALWAPGWMLVTAALAPGRLVEALVIAGGSLAVAVATELTLRWPYAPALPAAVVFLAYAVDLVRGSPLIERSLAGPNPFGGARFYGIGNELETILSVSVLVGAGAAAAWLARARPSLPASWLFAVAALVAAAIMGAGRLGADVGAVITLAVGAAAAVLASLGGRPSRRGVLLAVAAPVTAVGALILVDVVTHGGSHLTRSVLHANGSGDLADIVKRRVRAAFSPLRHANKAIVFALALAILAALAAWRDRLLAPLARAPGGMEMRAGATGAFFAVIAAMLANDSGPLMLEIGAVLLALVAAYVACAPPLRDP